MKGFELEILLSTCDSAAKFTTTSHFFTNSETKSLLVIFPLINSYFSEFSILVRFFEFDPNN